MRIIDCRNGDDVVVGQTVFYPDGDSWTLLRVRDRILTAHALVRSIVGGRRRAPHWVQLDVRFLHPAFFFERVGFFSS